MSYLEELINLEDQALGMLSGVAFSDLLETPRLDSANLIQTIIERGDRVLRGLEDRAIATINTALESAWADLESQLLTLYNAESPGSLLARDRALVIFSQVADLLTIVNTRNAEEIQKALENLLRGSTAQGTTLAQELTRAIADEQLQRTAQIPLAAIRNQAEEGVTRLRKHSATATDKINAIVTQGLVQGLSADKVKSLLQQELGLLKHRAKTIARTETLSATNKAAIANYRENGIDLILWQATTEACPICISRNQKVYQLGDVVIPAHPNCRCFASPVVSIDLIDLKWSARFRQQRLQELKANGFDPDDGPSPFEKANGVNAPVPVWEPPED